MSISINMITYFDDNNKNKLGFMFEDIIGVSKDMFGNNSKSILLLFELPNECSAEFLHSLDELAHTLSSNAFIGIRLSNEKANNLNFKLSDYGFQDINFYCGFDNSVPFLYIKDEAAKLIYDRMWRLVKED